VGAVYHRGEAVSDTAHLNRARQRIVNLETERDELRALLDRAKPVVCSYLCPSVRRDDEEWKHSALCQAMRKAIEQEL
jgi:hypothetical protein